MVPRKYPYRHGILCLILLASGVPVYQSLAGEGIQLVLLKNGNVLRGATELQGDLVLLQRDDGSHLRFPRSEMACTAATIEELYRYRLSQRSFRNPAVCVEDVRWCLRHGLLDAAETELKTLNSMDPAHPQISLLARQIESARSPHPVQPTARPSESDDHQSKADRDLSTDIPPAAVAAFASRVQPLLINRCANSGCHRSDGEVKWKLATLGFNVRVSSRMTQQNLAATLRFINVGDPPSSELLKYVSMPHANGAYTPTSRSTQSADAALREWLSQLSRYPEPLVGNQPANLLAAPAPDMALTDTRSWPVIRAANNETVPDGFAIDDDGELIYDPEGEFKRLEPASEPQVAGWPAPVLGPAIQVPMMRNGSAQSRSIETAKPAANQTESTRPQRLPTIANPFSADLFNRQFQRTSASDNAR